MSRVHSTPEFSPPESDNPVPTDLTALAASLQEAAKALLSLTTNRVLEPTHEAPLREREGEIRSFYFPPATLHMERELLRRYRAQDFQALLGEAHFLLVGLIKLMRSVPGEARVRGQVIASLGAQLEHASALLLRMRNAYEGVTPVQR